MSKGFDFERKMCKKLSLWWTNGSDENVFWRVEGSGGRPTNKPDKDLPYSYGDMSIKNPIGKPAIDFALWEFKKGFTSMGRLKPGALRELNHQVQQMGLTAFSSGKSKKGKITSSPFMTKISGFISKLKKSGKFDVMDFVDGLGNKAPLFWEWWEKAEAERKASKRPWTIFIIERDGKKPIVAVKENLYRIAATAAKVDDAPQLISLWYKEQLIYFLEADLFFASILTPDIINDLLKEHQNRKPKRLKRRRKKK